MLYAAHFFVRKLGVLPFTLLAVLFAPSHAYSMNSQSQQSTGFKRKTNPSENPASDTLHKKICIASGLTPTSFLLSLEAVETLVVQANEGSSEAQNKLMDIYWNEAFHVFLNSGNIDFCKWRTKDLCYTNDRYAFYVLRNFKEIGGNFPGFVETIQNRAIKDKIVEAQFNLGWMYRRGWGVPKNEKEAFLYFQMAADQKLAQAQRYLGWMYANCEEFKDHKKAFTYYVLSANQGYTGAQYDLGGLYRNGIGIKKDLQEAYKWYKLAADQGNSISQVTVANICTLFQEEAQKNQEEVFNRLKQDADEEDAVAQTIVALMYEKEGQNKNALDYYKRAAAQRDAWSQILVACYYRKRDSNSGQPEQLAEYIKFAKAQKYLVDGYDLRTAYSQDHMAAIKEDPEKAFENFGRAALKLHGPQYDLAMKWKDFLLKGQQYTEESFKYRRYAADQGDAASQYRVALYGESSDVDILHYLTLSANQGYSKAQVELAERYKDGIGVEPNIYKAVALFYNAIKIKEKLDKSEITKCKKKLSEFLTFVNTNDTKNKPDPVAKERDTNLLNLCISSKSGSFPSLSEYLQFVFKRHSTDSVMSEKETIIEPLARLYGNVKGFVDCLQDCLKYSSKASGWLITCVQPTTQLLSHFPSSNEEKNEFCFLKLDKQWYTCIGAENVALGHKLKDVLNKNIFEDFHQLAFGLRCAIAASPNKQNEQLEDELALVSQMQQATENALNTLKISHLRNKAFISENEDFF